MQIDIAMTRGSRWFTDVLVVVVLALVVCASAVGSARASLVITGFDGQYTAGPAGGVFTQAGGHPYEVRTQVEVNHHPDPVTSGETPVAPLKDVLVSLPAGVAGNPSAASTCTSSQLVPNKERGFYPECPISSQIGIARISGDFPFYLPLFNMQVPPTVPGRIGLNFVGVPIVLDASLRSDGDYGLDVDSRDISEALPVFLTEFTIWGVPADPSHDEQRCLGVRVFSPTCVGSPGKLVLGPNSDGLPRVPFMTLPTRCTAPGVGVETKVRIDSWREPGVFQEASFLTHEAPYFPASPGEWGGQVGLTGCDRVPFTPGIGVHPVSSTPDSPTGLDVALSFPTDGLENPSGVAQADLKKTVVSLPQGVVINPAAADGLGACTPAQIGLGSKSEPSCPDASKIGTVEAVTPVLKDPLEGSLYLATQTDNPFGSLLAGYLVVQGSGVIVKVPVKLEADPVSGRLTATLDNLPQAPLSNVKITVKGGTRAPLATPSACGGTETTSLLEGWTGASLSTTTPYTVDCTPGLGGFSPSFTAGTTNNQAGAYSPFVLSFSRNDGEQALSGIQQTLAPGLLAKLAGVPLCSNTDAAAGTCPASSQIGTVTAAAGVGPDPFSVGGKIYLTGPYNGGPFGEVVVVPVVAGPFNLGTVAVRGSIRIDPHTAQATVVSDPFPQILQGIPTHLRRVDVSLDRPNFTFNPTNCEPLSIPGTLSSAQGSTVNVSSRFQAANCAALPFTPSFKVSTKGATSKTSGASLDVKVTSGSGQANLGKVAVTLPKQLPSWLPTIQQACLAAVFNANPAACPAGSDIGTATATTPILANPVSGPVYLVSHGGAAFPDIVMVLQGEGVTVEQVGSINIKGQITSSAFNSIPDVPLSTFELNLPQGPHHALSTNLPAKAKGSFCGQSLVMPTTLTGQNGAQIKQNTKIQVTGCTKAKAKKKPKKHRKKKGGK